MSDDRTFVITRVWFDTYDEECEESFEDKYGYTQSYEQPTMHEDDEVITLDGTDEPWEERDLDMEIADAISNATGFCVYEFAYAEVVMKNE